MGKILAKTDNLTREQWLEKRREGIGGSDLGAICGVNKYRTALDVYLDKVAESSEDEGNEYTYWGNVLEDIVAKEFAKRTGKKIRKRNSIFKHEKYDFMLANIDREIIGENSGLECKTASVYNSAAWDDGIPESYELQCHHYMAVMGYERMYIACLIGGNKFVYHTIERNEDIINYLTQIESNFWHENVLKKQPPFLADTEAATGESLLRAYPNGNSSFAGFDRNEDFKIDRLLGLKVQKKEIEKEIETIETDLKQRIGDFSGALSGKYKVLWSNTTTKRFDTETFKKDYPALFGKYTKETNGRRFSVKEIQQ